MERRKRADPFLRKPVATTRFHRKKSICSYLWFRFPSRLPEENQMRRENRAANHHKNRTPCRQIRPASFARPPRHCSAPPRSWPRSPLPSLLRSKLRRAAQAARARPVGHRAAVAPSRPRRPCLLSFIFSIKPCLLSGRGLQIFRREKCVEKDVVQIFI